MITRSNSLNALLVFSISLGLMYFGRSVMIPIAFSLLIAFVIHPICSWLEKRRVGRAFSILIGEIMVFALLAGLIWLLIWQFSSFLQEWPAISKKLQASLVKLNGIIVEEYEIPIETQFAYLQTLLLDNTNRLFSLVQNMLFVSATGLVMLVLIPFYTALILYYRHLWVKALVQFTGEENRARTMRIVQGAVGKYFDFVKGMLVVYLIVGILNSIGLAILGVPHPVLFGVIASVLTFIPYFGIMVGSLLPMAVAWVTFDSAWYPLGVVLIFGFVQYLEANFIFPLAVSVRMKVNTLVSIVAIFTGALIWGGAGMILFVPFLGILKLVAEEIEEWKPLATLLGDDS